jgi:magnesium-protoporphyrin O-methyltransferase
VARSCCAGESLDIFTDRFARRAQRRYLRRGLGAEEKLMAGWAAEGGLDGASVLEVGGGVGALQAELVRRGAEAGIVAEVVGGYEPFARELATAAGIEDRTSFVRIDLLETPDAVAPADVVALRRVVCCTPDGPALLAAAARLTHRILLVSYPRDRRLVRGVVRVQNALLALARKRFRAFVHDPAELEAAARSVGLTAARRHRSFVWETVSFTP